MDVLNRNKKYNEEDIYNIFISKFNYIKECKIKLNEIKEKYSLVFSNSNILYKDILELQNDYELHNKFDACITSPPYYFSIDYIGKDAFVYDYLNIPQKYLREKYLGMKLKENTTSRIEQYFNDLYTSLKNIYLLLKSNGKLALIIGDSTVKGKKLNITEFVNEKCKEIWFKIIKNIFNLLLSSKNRAIIGETIIICEK